MLRRDHFHPFLEPGGPHRLSRLLMGLVSLALMATACSTTGGRVEEAVEEAAAPTDAGSTVPAEAGATAQPAVDQHFLLGAPEDTTELEPAPEANVAMGYGDANAPVFEGLVEMAPDFTIEPVLATSWEFVEPNTWRFELREGVTFHDGQPFNADAVAYTINELWANTDSNLTNVGPESAVAVDEHTVEVTPTEDNLRFLQQIGHPSKAMIAPGTFAGEGTSPENTPTGTGPFHFVSYNRGQELVVDRNNDYWGEPTQLDRITIRFYPDDTSRVLALQSGEVDAIYDVPREQAPALEAEPELQIARSGVGAYDAILLNSHGEPPYDILQDRRVREALALGINKEAIVENVWRGNAEVMQTLIPAPVLGQYADMVQGHPYDPDRARALLEEAGWTLGDGDIRTKDGRRLEMTMLAWKPELQQPMPELVKAQLEEIGIDLTLDISSDSSIYFDRLGNGEGDLFAEVGNQNDANPIFLGAIFTGVQPGGFGSYGAAFGPEGAYDDAFREAFTTPDTERVRELAATAMHVAVDEYIAAVPIAGIYRIWGLSDRVQGFVPHPSSANQKWDAVWLAAP